MHSLAGCRVVAGGYQQSLAVIISSLHSGHKHVCKYSQTPAKQKQTVLAFKVKAAHFNDCSGKTQLLLWSLMFSVSSLQTFSSSSIAQRVNAGVYRHIAMFYENYVWLRQSASEQQSKAIRLRLLMQHLLCNQYYRFHIATQICYQLVSGPVCLRPKVRKDKETQYSDNTEFKCTDKIHNENKGWLSHLPPRSQSTAPFWFI